MPTINTVPYEIVAHIFSFLTRANLTVVTLVSKRYQTIAEPILYKHPLLGHKNDSVPSRLQIFLRTVLTRPRLATYVRAIYLEWGTNRIDCSVPQNSTDLALFLAAAKKVALRRRCDCRGTQAALLLYQLPNLQVLELSSTYRLTEFDAFLEDLAWCPVESLPAGLKSVHKISYINNWNTMTPLSIIAIIKLPSIRTVCLRAIHDMTRLDRIPDAYNGRSSVSELSIGPGTMWTHALANVLRMPQALTRFSFNHILGSRSRFDYVEIGKGLETTRDTLQYLSLRLDMRVPLKAGENHNSEMEVQQTIGSLHDWPVLRTVHCPLAALLGRQSSRLVDVLPAIVQEYTAFKDHFWQETEVMIKLLELIENKAVCGPAQLTKVSAHFGKKRVKALRAACVLSGVALGSYNPYDY